jgi:hypothetical protein
MEVMAKMTIGVGGKKATPLVQMRNFQMRGVLLSRTGHARNENCQTNLTTTPYYQANVTMQQVFVVLCLRLLNKISAALCRQPRTGRVSKVTNTGSEGMGNVC